MCLRLAEENGIPKFLLISIPTESHVTTACFCNMCKAIDHFHYNIVEWRQQYKLLLALTKSTDTVPSKVSLFHIHIALRKLLLLFPMRFLHKENHNWEGVPVLVAVLKYISLPELPSDFWWDFLLWKIWTDSCLVYLISASLGQI